MIRVITVLIIIITICVGGAVSVVLVAVDWHSCDFCIAGGTAVFVTLLLAVIIVSAVVIALLLTVIIGSASVIARLVVRIVAVTVCLVGVIGGGWTVPHSCGLLIEREIVLIMVQARVQHIEVGAAGVCEGELFAGPSASSEP